MSAVTSFILYDAQATPVAHQFVPLGPDQTGTWWFEDQSASNAIGYNRISIQLVRATNPAPGASAQGRVARVKIGIHTPALESLGSSSVGFAPAPTIAFIERSNHEYILPERGTVESRKNHLKFSREILNQEMVAFMVERLQGLY